MAAGLPAPETDVVVSGLSFDSRRVNPGDLYLALPGARAHGASFASQAAANGAVAILTDAEGAKLAADTTLPVLVAAEPRRAMASVAVAFYGRPAESLRTFAVTGTNGKTTSVYILSAALSAAGATVGSIGTNGFQLAG
ncbi:MAG: UDP-N-acetylmuramoyl-L-alanyl-D-glutamate--2,6-diaminopimelate ligase, partial [Propionibacteriales bacterium]